MSVFCGLGLSASILREDDGEKGREGGGGTMRIGGLRETKVVCSMDTVR
jgi:hypothetical protein